MMPNQIPLNAFAARAGMPISTAMPVRGTIQQPFPQPGAPGMPSPMPVRGTAMPIRPVMPAGAAMAPGMAQPGVGAAPGAAPVGTMRPPMQNAFAQRAMY